MNAEWHLQHKLARNASIETRIAWHLEHQRQCACRPIPATVGAHLPEVPASKKRAAKRTTTSRAQPALKATLDPRIAQLVKAFAKDGRVTSGKMMTSHGLKVDGKIFAMLVQGRLVVKLPKARVDELVAAGRGERFAPRKDGRVMKEWLSVSSAPASWSGLAAEARRFVGNK